GWALFHCVESGWRLVRESGDEIPSESRMREIRTSGLMSGERKRATASRPRPAPFLDSTGSDDPVSDSLCLPRPGTRTPSHCALCGHAASDGGVDCTAITRSLSLGHSAALCFTRS